MIKLDTTTAKSLRRIIITLLSFGLGVYLGAKIILSTWSPDPGKPLTQETAKENKPTLIPSHDREPQRRHNPSPSPAP